MLGVVIPAYNCKDTLPDTLNSLVAQTKKMFMVVVVDDASEQGKEIQNIVESYKSKLHIYYKRYEENGGPGKARQYGTDLLSDICDYIMYIDADDMIYPRAIEILYQEAKKNDVDMISSNIMHEEQGCPGSIIDGNTNITWVHGKMFKTSFLKKYNIRFKEKIYNEDLFFGIWVDYFKEKAMSIPEITYIWRDNKESITRKSHLEFIKKSNFDYVIGQCEFLNYLIQNNDTKYNYKKLISVITKIYCYYMREKFLLKDRYEILKETIAPILSSKYIIDIFKKKMSIPVLVRNLTAAEQIGKNRIFFYSFNFIDWLKEMGAYEIVKILECKDD